MTDTVESLYQAFTDYRRRCARGAYPIALRRRAIASLTLEQRLQLAARIGLTADQVNRWGGGTSPQQPTTQEFFEVLPAAPAAVASPEFRLEVQLRNGVILRPQGRVDADTLRMLVAALQTESTL